MKARPPSGAHNAGRGRGWPSRSRSLQQPGLHADTLILHPYCHNPHLGRPRSDPHAHICADPHAYTRAYTNADSRPYTNADSRPYTNADSRPYTNADSYSHTHADSPSDSYTKAGPPAYSAEHWP